MTRSRALILALAAAAAVSSVPAPARAAAAPGETVIRRFALIVGSNEGGAGRVRLRYATSDATSFSRVLGELGGIRASEQLLLIEPDRTALELGFERMRHLVSGARAAGTRLEFVFYYSGHSDEDGLLPRGDRVAYSEIKRWIEQAGADVRIAILDSCASGALTRAKGGVRRAPFLVDGSSQAHGHAFLTASSADEAAQESDRLGAAFFTHYLLSGLRGAADSSRDGRVTLNEAYQYAFHETLARTQQTRAGAQHPTYDFQLAGSGDLVMTDLHGASATLTIADEVAGRVFVRDAQGHLVAEVRKTAGHAVDLGLEPGRYSMTLEDERGLRAATVDINRGGHSRLAFADMAPLTPVATVSRGDEQAPEAPQPAVTLTATAPGPAPLTGYTHVAFALGLFPALRTGIAYPQKSIDHVIIGFPWAGSDKLHGFAAALGASWVTEEVRGFQFAIGMNYAGANSFAVQSAVGANVVAGSLAGIQDSIGFNAVTGDLKGLQSSVGFNTVGGTLEGMQATVGFNAAPSVRGAAVQLAVGFNIANRGEASGWQAAVGFNEFGGKLRGVQTAVGLNRANELSGAQIGLINVGNDIYGAQVGLINVARSVRGAQVGLINVAQTSNAPIGLISVVRFGRFNLATWGSDGRDLSLGLKLGGHNFYSIIFATVLPKGTDRRYDNPDLAERPEQSDRTRWASGLGFGMHLDNSPRFYTNIELLASAIHKAPFYQEDNTPALLSTARLLVGFNVARRFSVFAGAAYNVMVGFDNNDYGYGTGVLEEKYCSGSTTVRRYPSLILGAQI